MQKPNRAAPKRGKKTARRRSTVDPLTQVRELLFGSAAAENENRHKQLAARLQKRLARQALAHAARAAQLSTRLTKARHRFDRSLAELQRELGQFRMETRREMNGALQGLREEYTAKLVEIEQRFAEAMARVEHGKTDRTALASLFEDFAHRVSGNQRR